MAPSGLITHSLGKVAERVPGVRRIPLLKLLSIAEVAILARDHYRRLTPAERRRLAVLVRDGRGRTRRLTDAETEELHGLVAKLAPRQLLGDTVDRLSPVPLPRRLVHGPRR